MSLHNNNYDNHNDAAAELPEATADLRSQEFSSSADEAGFDASADMDIDADVEASGEVNGFEAMNLNPALLQAVAALGYTQPTAVQAETIPNALAGGDWMVSSQTGSGKTAAFLLPALHALLETPAMSKGEQAARSRRAGASPRVLVLCPTRELAAQVAAEAISLVRFVRGIRIANVVGGTAFGKQLMELRGANLVVATPGRLLDLNRNGQIDLDCVQTLVVDEADRMLDLGFSDDLAEINQLTIQRHQTMMFSATFAPRIQSLAQRVMRAPQKVQIDSPQDKHSSIEQQLFWCDSQEHKRQLLDHWLRDATIDQAIVFASTQIECDSLAEELQQVGFSAVALHGALSQGLRTRRLMALRNGQVQILVATDVAARGIDVPTITHVFNYGLPLKAEDYTHRIGRTGRAGRKGLAVTMAEFRDRRKIDEIEAYSQQVIKTATIPGLEPKKQVYEFNDRRPAGRGGNGRGAPPRGGNSRGGAGGGGWGGRSEGGFGGNSGRPASRGDFQPRGEFRSEPRGDVRFEPRGDARPAGRGEFRGGDRAEPRGEFRGESRGFAGRDQRPQGGFGGEQRRESFGRPAGGERSFGDRPAFERRGNESRGHGGGAPSFGDRRPRPEGGAGKPRFVKR